MQTATIGPSHFCKMQMAAGGSLTRDARKMSLSRPRKMRGHGREQLGLKVYSKGLIDIPADTTNRLNLIGPS